MPFTPDPQHFLDQAVDLFCTANDEGYLTWVNHRWEEVLGWSFEELTSRPYIELVHPDDVSRTLDRASAIIRSGGLEVSFRNRYQTRSGAYRWLDWTSQIGPDGLWYCVVRDVTEQTEQQRRIVEEAQLLQMSEALAQVGTWRIDLARQTLVWSDEVYRIHGFEPRSFEPDLGTAIDFYHPDDRQAVSQVVQAAIERGEPFRFERRVVRPDGSIRHVESFGRSVHDASGEPTGVVGVFQDVTDRALREELLREQVLSAQSAARSKSEFLANMSHEIRTPLNAILGMNELLGDTELTPSQQEMVGTVQSAGQNLLRLIDDILDLAKVEAGRVVLESLPVDLSTLLGQVRDLFSGKAQERGLELILDVEGLEHRWVQTDPTRLSQVLGNLVSNAIKFTDEGSVALAGSSRVTGEGRVEVDLSVVDTGIGIAPDQREAVFAAFAQADGGTTRRFGGTGLGLSISRRLVEAMGGELFVDSVLEQGSTFRIQLDLEAAEPTLDEPTTELDLDALEGLKVLVVEDNPVNQRVAFLMLRRIGCEPLLASSGEEGLEMWARHRPQLVLMDVQMPGIDGYETTRRLRRREAEHGLERTPILGLTAHAMAPDQRRCIEAGMDEHMSKPIGLRRLTRALGRIYGARNVA